MAQAERTGIRGRDKSDRTCVSFCREEEVRGHIRAELARVEHLAQFSVGEGGMTTLPVRGSSVAKRFVN